MITRYIACLLITVTCCHSALGESLRLVTGDEYAPFTGKTLPAGGVLTQIVQAAWQQRGVASQLEWRPWSRGYNNTLRGDYDATFPYMHTEARAEVFLYSQPVFTAEQYIFSRAGEVIEIDDRASLQGLRLCYPLGWQPPPIIQQLVDAGTISRHAPLGLKECARLLLLGRDDFFIADYRLGETALQLIDASAQQFQRSASAISRSPLHLIVPRRHPHAAVLIEQFNEGLAALHASGDYQRLLEHYLEQRDASATLP